MSFRLNIVVCTNTEVMRDFAETACASEWQPNESDAAQDVFEREQDDYTDRVIYAVMNSLRRDFSSDGNFSNWSGGRYSHQAQMYGWWRIRGGVVRVVEDAEDETRVVAPHEWTPEQRAAVAALEGRIERAIHEESEKIRRDYMRDVSRQILARLAS